MNAMFIGTTTVSSQTSAAAVLMLDSSSSTPGSTPIATSREASRLGRTYAQSSSQIELSSSVASSGGLARTTDFSQQYPPIYEKPETSASSSGLRTSLIVLSAVLFVTAMVIGWIIWRRLRRQRLSVHERSSEMVFREPASTSPVLQETNVRQPGGSDLTCPIPVGSRDPRVKMPTDAIDSRCQSSNNRMNSTGTKLSIGRTIAKDFCSPRQPPIPPAKHTNKLPTGVPPSSPTLPIQQRYSSGHRGAAAAATTHMRIPSPSPLELRDFSPISPLPKASGTWIR